MSWLTDPNIWIAFATLAGLEIVLGIDNVVFISILVGRLPKAKQASAYRIGLGLAMISRILLLMSLSWVMGLTRPLFALIGHAVSGRDIVLLAGGLFLVAKSTYEIHNKLEGHAEEVKPGGRGVSYGGVLAQIMVLDIVFSLDSVITAVGMVQNIGVMVAAVVAAVLVMMVFAQAIGDFVHRHPTMKMLALAFLLLIGVMLIADGFGHHVPKGYIYFAMAFSLGVEVLNLRARRKGDRPVVLREPHLAARK